MTAQTGRLLELAAGGRLAQPLTPRSNHMTDQPTTDPTHGLSVQHADALWDAVAIPGPTAPTFPMQHERVCRAVAEILDELTPASPAVPVSSPPPDQTAIREAIDGALHRVLDSNLGKGAWTRLRAKATDAVLAVLAVLPPAADRAAVYRDAADTVEAMNEGCGQHRPCASCDARTDAADALRDIARRLAAETQAHPPTSTWKVESPRRDQWASWGATYDDRQWAQERYESAIKHGQGRPFRLVRATTTYTVEAEYPQPPVHKGGNADDCPA